MSEAQQPPSEPQAAGQASASPKPRRTRAAAKKPSAAKKPASAATSAKATSPKPAPAKPTARKAPASRASAAPAAAKKAPAAAATPKVEAEQPTPKVAAAERQPAADTKKNTFKEAFADQDRLSGYLHEVTERSRNVVQDVIDQQAKRGRSGGAWPFDPLNVGNAFLTIAKEFANDPGRAYEAQLDLWKEHVALWENAARRIVGQEPEPVAEPARGDKRFRHKAWTDSHVLDYLKQAYLITSKWMQDTVGGLDGLDPKEKKKIDFYTKQFADALSPTNFALTNPEVIEETLESRGENLLRGLRNLLADLDRGDGELIIRQTDLDYFKVGENVATAPGKVIYQNRVMQLIQYAPTTDKVYKRPLLIFPPWINKFYILDLREENSFIRWMTDQGHTVFLVSWVNPDPSLAELTFRDYAKEGVFAALDAIEKATGEREVNAIGYCIGGTLLSCSLAHMAETGDERIKSATYFAAQTDFSEAGDLLVFIDEKQLQNLEKQMEVSGGVLEGTSMAAAFNMLRANDLIWSFVINNYLMGKDPKRFDLLYWNSDATRMPKRLQIDYLREFYMYNKLSRGEFALFDKTLSVKNVKIPVYMQASETDHIAPCVSVFKGAKLFGGPVRFMVAGSGHIAGVINHPDAKKYQHWTNDKIADDKPGSLPGALNDWWENAEEHPGSWWGDWMKWLSPQSGPKVAARIPGEGALKPIEDAPGSYVKVKSLGD